MTTLSAVLTGLDLPDAELQAARLDGELYGLAESFCQIGEIEGPGHRARAALAGRSPRLIGELRTAAWVWGAGSRPRHWQFAVLPQARARVSPDQHVAVRELLFEPGDLADLAGARVTVPLRTVLDLARFDDPFDGALVARLAASAGLTLERCLLELESRPGIPAKNRARANLESARTYAVDTR